jgi:uncharacterized membrane protein
MFIQIHESHTRSIVKAISWRCLGSLDTFLITWLITGNAVAAGSVASLESLSKIVLFYLHERAWGKVAVGRKANAEAAEPAPAIVPAPALMPSPALVPAARPLTLVESPQGATS